MSASSISSFTIAGVGVRLESRSHSSRTATRIPSAAAVSPNAASTLAWLTSPARVIVLLARNAHVGVHVADAAVVGQPDTLTDGERFLKSGQGGVRRAEGGPGEPQPVECRGEGHRIRLGATARHRQRGAEVFQRGALVS